MTNRVPHITLDINPSIKRIITHIPGVPQELQEKIEYTDNPALLAVFEYLQRTHEGKKCPFVPYFHNNNAYYVSLYDQGKSVDFEHYFDALEPLYQDSMKDFKLGASQKLVEEIGVGLMLVLSDPSLNTIEFSTVMERALMEQKSKFIATRRMGGAMLSNPKGGAARISNLGQEENPIGLGIDHPFQVDGYNMTFYRSFHPGTLKDVDGFSKKSAISVGDSGSARTPQDMLSVLKNYSEYNALKYIGFFKVHLSSKPQKDIEYLVTLKEGKNTSEEIIMYFYEQYLMNLPNHCVMGIQSLLSTNFSQGILMIRKVIESSKIIYDTIANTFVQFENGSIGYDDMLRGIQLNISKLGKGGH